MFLTHLVYTNLQRYRNTLGSLGIGGFLGSGVRGAGSSDLSLPTGVGAATSHSAPLEHRTLCCPPSDPGERLVPQPGDGEHPSPPAPVGPPEAAHCGLARPRHFSCYPNKDIGRGYAVCLACGPGGLL